MARKQRDLCIKNNNTHYSNIMNKELMFTHCDKASNVVVNQYIFMLHQAKNITKNQFNFYKKYFYIILYYIIPDEISTSNKISNFNWL